jgi:hypothetical protein
MVIKSECAEMQGVAYSKVLWKKYKEEDGNHN